MASIIWFGLGLLTGIFVSQNYGDQVPDAKEMVQKVLSEVRPRPPNDELRKWAAARLRGRARCEPARTYMYSRPTDLVSPSVASAQLTPHHHPYGCAPRTPGRRTTCPDTSTNPDTPFSLPFFPRLPSTRTFAPSPLRLPPPDFQVIRQGQQVVMSTIATTLRIKSGIIACTPSPPTRTLSPVIAMRNGYGELEEDTHTNSIGSTPGGTACAPPNVTHTLSLGTTRNKRGSNV